VAEPESATDPEPVTESVTDSVTVAEPESGSDSVTATCAQDPRTPAIRAKRIPPRGSADAMRWRRVLSPKRLTTAPHLDAGVRGRDARTGGYARANHTLTTASGWRAR
jgi:hypothetical protein